MTSPRRELKVTEALAHHAADFFAREAGPQSLITVTRASVSTDLKNVTIFLSVIPATQEQTALAFAKRERTTFRNYIKEKSYLHPVPTVDFEIDFGEKNRQRIDTLTQK